jgi:hypothetical protein
VYCALKLWVAGYIDDGTLDAFGSFRTREKPSIGESEDCPLSFPADAVQCFIDDGNSNRLAGTGASPWNARSMSGGRFNVTVMGPDDAV